MDDPHSIDHVTCAYTLRCSFLDTNTMFPPRRYFDHPIASGDRNAGRRLIRRLIRVFARVTIQLKPHFLPRLIINSPTPSWSARARRNHLKTQRKWPDQVHSLDAFADRAADTWNVRNPYWPQQGLRNHCHTQKGQAKPPQGPVIQEDPVCEVRREGGCWIRPI